MGLYGKYFISGLAFYFGWFACVRGAASGCDWLGPVLILPYIASHLWMYGILFEDVVAILVIATAGTVIDSCYIALGFLTYSSPNLWVDWLCPPWITALYIMYSLTINHSLRWVGKHTIVTATIGSLGGVLSYIAGYKLEAVTFLVPETTIFAIIAGVWLIFAPLSFRLMRSMVHTR